MTINSNNKRENLNSYLIIMNDVNIDENQTNEQYYLPNPTKRLILQNYSNIKLNIWLILI